jgi:uncharacterized protein (UPF0276 family)
MRGVRLLTIRDEGAPAWRDDRVGLSWRPELAAGIVAHLDRIDVLEVLGDDHLDVPARDLRALATLGAHVPLVLHGVSLGLASAAPVDPRRLERWARLLDVLRPAFWSEHLAFVRGGGVEIGHLAAPPRTDATIEGAVRNLAAARAVTGATPLVENVATLIDPPTSRYDEATWVARILAASGAPLLLDLHNLLANATNFGFDPLSYLAALPADRIAAVHLAGGHRHRGRILDDHLHDVPDPVYELLDEVGRLAPRPLTVIIERDGRYPPIRSLLAEVERARAALAAGRARRAIEAA